MNTLPQYMVRAKAAREAAVAAFDAMPCMATFVARTAARDAYAVALKRVKAGEPDDLVFYDAPDTPVPDVVLIGGNEDITFYAYGEA